jgi:hypothetical protein
MAVTLLTLTARPALAQDATFTPVQRTLTADLATGTHHYSAALPVPKGKRLVIEYVSVRIVPRDPTSVVSVNEVAIATSVQGVVAKHSLANSFNGPGFQAGVGYRFVLGQEVKFYADGATPVTATLDLFNYGDDTQYLMTGTIEWTISGYLIG